MVKEILAPFQKLPIVLKIIILLVSTLMVWFAVHTVIIVMDGRSDDFKNTDVAVVLGNKVELDGRPSERLQARLDKAVSLYNKGYFEYIIVSGGIGEEGYDEALVMNDYLIEQGVPDDFIVLDSNGYNTYMTAQNTKTIQEEMGFTSITVISQYHHITRTKLAFKKVGFEQVYSGTPKYYELRDVYSIVREFVAYYRYLLK